MRTIRQWVGPAIVACLTVYACNRDPYSTGVDSSPRAGQSTQSPSIHVMRALGGAGPASPAPSPGLGQGNITYHGGPIIYATRVATIYWGTTTIYSGGPTPGTIGSGSQDGSLVGFFLNHLGGSHYFNINTGYYDNTGTHVQNVLTYTQYWADNSDPGSAPSDADIIAEVTKAFTTGELTYDPSTLYHVLTGSGVNLGGGFGGYCAYHGHFTWNGNDVKYSAMPYALSPGVGCNLLNGSPNNDPAADAEVNLLAHETEETTTDEDPLTAWYDAANFENGDKCAWLFGSTYTTSNGATANINVGGRNFLVQQNWINVAPQECGLHLLKASITGPHTIPVGIVCTWTGGTVRGGVPPFAYQWSSTPPLTGWSPQNGTFNGLSEGAEGNATLSVIVTDANGETDQETDTVRVTRMTNICQ